MEIERNYAEILYNNRYVNTFCRYIYYFFGINLLNHPALTAAANYDEDQLTIEEQFNEFLNKEEYSTALKIALENNLNTDLVYQLQWTNKPITIDSIQDHLANVNNKSWVIQECLTKLGPDFESMYALLDHGLIITDLNEIFDFNPDDVNVDDLQDLEYDEYQTKVETRINEQHKQFILKSIENLTSDQRHFIISRQILLNYREKLKLFEKINEINCDLNYCDDEDSLKFDYDEFERIRNQSYLEMAINYAHENNWKAIQILFTHVGDSTLQHRLPILNNFPETLSPLNYQKLLPSCSNDSEHTVVEWTQTKLIDKLDWSLIYCQDIRNDLIIKAEEYELNFYLNNPDYIEYKTRDLNADLLENWYKRRAREIEDLSSLVNNSLTLLSIGIKNNVPNLESLKKEMETYHMLIYECLPRYNLGDISFSDFEKYSINKKIDLLMCGAKNKKENFVECFQLLLLPFLDKNFDMNSNERFEYMHNYLLSVAKQDLNFIYQLFKHYYDLNMEINQNKHFSPELEQIFHNIETLIKLTIDCIYSNSEPNQLDIADNIFRCLPDSESVHTHNDLVILKNNLNVANFLSIYNYQICPSFVKEIADTQNKHELMQIFKSVIKTAIQRLPTHATVFHLQEILNDLLEIKKLTFDSIVTDIEINSLFIRSLLMSGKLEILNLIKELMRINYSETPVELNESDESIDETLAFKFNLPMDAYLNLILECAVDYVNSADSVIDNLIEVARICLKLAPTDCKSIKDELNFIQALQILNNEFDLHLLPVQIRLFPEPRIDIIIAALKSFPKAYKKVNILLELGELCQVYAGEEKVFRESKILSLIGDFAIKSHDYKECYFICKIIMDKEYQLAWEICRKLALIDEFTDKEAKYKLLSYALTYCPDDGNEISCIVNEIKSLKISLNENTTKKSLPDLIINKTQDVSGLILNTTQDVAQVTSHLTKWLIQNVIREDDNVRIAKQYETIDKEYEMESKNKLIMNSLNMPSFYNDAFERYSNFKIKNNDLDIDYKHYSLPEIKSSSQPFSVGQMLLRTHLLKYDLNHQQTKPNDEVISTINLLQELAYFALFHDTSLALSYLKSLSNYQLTEKVFNQLSTKSPTLVYIALYFYSLELCLKLQPKFDLDNFSIKDTIFKAEAYLIANKKVDNLNELIEKYRKLFNDLMKADSLLSFYPEIDVNRFVNDERYKKETLLGLAMTEDDQTLENVKNMAIQYNVSLFEVYLSYLENLLTFSSMETSEMDKKIFENIELMSAMIERYEEVTSVFIKRIYPLIGGSDYDKLILYYKILEKINDDNRSLKLEFVNHFKNLKKLKKCFVDSSGPALLDYKQLIEEKKTFVELLYSTLNEQNCVLLARWTITLKLDLKNSSQQFNPSAVYSVWLRKNFLLNRPNWKETYDESIETIKKLNATDYLHFIKFFLLSPDSKNLMSDLNERFYYLESSLEYVKKKISKSKKEEQKEWSKTEEEMEKIIELINVE